MKTEKGEKDENRKMRIWEINKEDTSLFKYEPTQMPVRICTPEYS